MITVVSNMVKLRAVAGRVGGFGPVGVLAAQVASWSRGQRVGKIVHSSLSPHWKENKWYESYI